MNAGQNLIKLTIFTPTYNRKNALKRAYDSLTRQTNKHFIWLIIDDGSTDGTGELIETFVQMADFEIEYHWKENGGRHTAVNYSYEFLQTEYVVTLDSDDELTDDAVNLILNTWEAVSANDYSRIWCVTGREIDYLNRKMVGKPFPNNINTLKGKKQHREILKCPGEKHCCRKVQILKQYHFPVYSDCKFVTENQVWEKINKKYDQYCTNEIFGIYYTDSIDSLSVSHKRTKSRYCTFYHAGIFYVNELFEQIFYNKDVLYYLFNVSRCAMLTKRSWREVMSELNAWYKKVFVTMGYPVSYLWIITHITKDNYNYE